tara:strand:+ start:660 stop:800 length:141 start_codon:yes stop_codon:yes gene_type:complete
MVKISLSLKKFFFMALSYAHLKILKLFFYSLTAILHGANLTTQKKL